jgi:hypothetical protein
MGMPIKNLGDESFFEKMSKYQRQYTDIVYKLRVLINKQLKDDKNKFRQESKKRKS